MAYLIQLQNGTQTIVQSLGGHEADTVLDDNYQDLMLDDLKAIKRSQVDALLAAAFAAGFAPTAGPLVGHTLQVRNNDDRTNWLTSQASYSAAVAAGAGAVTDAEFRTAANDTVICSYADGLNTLLAMAAWGKALMGKSWAIKDTIDALTDHDSVEAVDVAALWAA